MSDSIESDIKLATLEVFADGHYQVEIWCPVNEALVQMASALQDLLINADEAEEESRKMGYEQ